jgi:hypothetical protein
MAPLSALNYRLSLLKDNLQPRGVKIKAESPGWSEVQAVLARGGTKLAEVLATIERVSLSGWRQTVEECHLDVDFYAHQRWDVTQRLPWEMLDLGTKSGYLELELKRALAQFKDSSHVINSVPN